MEIHSYTVGPFQENTYLLIEGRQALLIDPGFNRDEEVKKMQYHLSEGDVRISAICLTHAHVDHILGLKSVLSLYEVPVYLNNHDRYLWNNYSSQAKMFGIDAADFSFTPKKLPEQHDFQIDSFSFDLLYTPGHAPDHVSLYFGSQGFLIVGDALFKEGIGRTDLYKGDRQLLEKSIREKLYRLPEETIVYAGHGPSTTIGHEKKSNPFVKANKIDA